MRPPQRPTKPAGIALACFLVLALLLASSAAGAHEIGLSRGAYVLEGERVEATLAFGRGDAALFVAEGKAPALPGQADPGWLEALEAKPEAAGAAILRGVSVRPVRPSPDAKAEPCAGELVSAGLVEEDGFEAKLAFRCPGPPPRIVVELGLLSGLPLGHRHVATARSDERERTVVLSRKRRALLLEPAAPGTGEAPAGGFFAFVGLGVEHVVTGYDHLAFLLGLVLLPASLRARALTVTAFTVGHSVTLCLAALGVVTLPSRLVEVGIALSVAYVGVENFFVKDAERRYLLTLPFGLLHGLGFAGALGDLRVPREELPASLAAFNVGVELGQLAVLALLLPLLALLDRRPKLRGRAVAAVSALLVGAGLAWAAVRAFG